MNVVILEDEQAATRRLEKLLLEINPDINILARLESVESALSWFQENPPPDLLLQDIHLADGSSFELFDYIQITTPVIFTTAYDEYALKAFKVNAIDYLLKPIKKTELEQALEKFRQTRPAVVPNYERIGAAVRKQNQETPATLQRLLVRLGASMKLIDISDAAYFYTRDKITFLVSRSQNRRFPLDMPLDKLETRLDPARFFRINRQFIVQIDAIGEMKPSSKSRLKIELHPPADTETVVSTERSGAFKRWLVGKEAE
ncbi:MAG: response regulator transcription factor [Chitinophagales bacterium]|nr:response regulator transcription factor [Chitinophagales bacterium]